MIEIATGVDDYCMIIIIYYITICLHRIKTKSLYIIVLKNKKINFFEG